MPQIDFGRAFSASDQATHAQAEDLFSTTVTPAEIPGEIEPSRFRRSRLGRSDWTNILFVVIAIFGGLFCAFYFFNGAELLRTAAAWPREFLYAQPFAAANGKIDNYRFGVTQGSPAGATSESSANSAPFAHSAAPLQGLNQSPIATAPATATTNAPAAFAFAGSGSSPSIPPAFSPPSTPPVSIPPVSTPPSPDSLLSQLGRSVPGGDALMQTLNKAVGDLQHATLVNAHRVVVVVQTPVSRITRRVQNPVKNATQNALANLKGPLQTAQNVRQGVTGALNAQLASAQNRATGAVGSALSAGQSALGGGLGGVGALGGLGTSGGLRGGIGSTGIGVGGLGGGAIGGLGGAVGGLGGVVGGITGGIHVGGGGRHH